MFFLDNLCKEVLKWTKLSTVLWDGYDHRLTINRKCRKGFHMAEKVTKQKGAITLSNGQTFVPKKKLFQTLMMTSDWNREMGIDTVGDLNDQICQGNISDMILVQEALQERRIGEIARDIARREGVKFVMIAGPSSSGKTSFSHRLSIQLRTYGLKPHPIGLDNYYLNHDKTPLDDEGKPDYECLEALDVEQFNTDMSRLLQGESVELPSFNFKTGKREYRGKITTLGPDDILVIEGIHGLN